MYPMVNGRRKEQIMIIIKYISKILLWIPSLALLTVMLVTVANVLGRSLFKNPVSGAIEIAGLFGSIVVSLSLFYTQLKDRNVATDIIFNKLHRSYQRILEKITFVLGTGTVGLMIYSCALGVLESYTEKDVTTILTIPIWPFMMAFLIGGLAFCIVLIGQFYRSIAGGTKE